MRLKEKPLLYHEAIDEKTEVRYNKFYPLVMYTTRTIVWKEDKKHSTRWVSRSKKYDKRWKLETLALLYARQIAKLQNKERLKMELPYSVRDIYCTDAVENEYNKHRIQKDIKSKPKLEISGEEILENELFGE